MKKNIKIILAILSIVLVMVFFSILGTTLIYRLFQIKTEVQGDNIKYTDLKFGYSFIYPKSWKRFNPFLGAGQVSISSSKNPEDSIIFWYKDSERVDNINQLLTFVEDDAKWAEENQGVHTEFLDKTVFNDQKEVVLWKSIDGNEKEYTYYQQYYIADFGAEDVNIWIWTINIITGNKKEPIEKALVDKIIKSYTLLP